MRIILHSILLLSLTALMAPETAGAAPARTKPGKARTTKKKPKPAPKDSARILLVGDSLMATALGQRLELRLNAIPGVYARRVARSATGLARPDVHDWPAVAARAVTPKPPHLVVLLIGSNDGQDLAHAKRKPHRRRKVARRPRNIHWGAAAWNKAYRSRVDRLLRVLGGKQRLVLWMGLPPMRSRSLEKKLALVRREQRAGTLALGSTAQYVGLFPFVRDIRKQAPRNKRGKPVPGWLFKRDGVHFSYHGSRRFTRAFEPVLWPWIARAMVRAAQER